MNPVWSGENAEVLSLAGVEESVEVRMGEEEVSIDTCQSKSCGSENSGSIDNPEEQTCRYGNRRSIDSPEDQSCSSVAWRSIAANPCLVDIPVDSDGLAENPDAYRLWQPKRIEDEEISMEEWQERWSKLRERLSMAN